MQVIFCDICHELIKEGDKKYILGVNPVKQESEQVEEELKKNVYEYLRHVQNQINKLQLMEICEECKKVLEYFFSIRKKELEETKLEIQKMIKNNSLDEI